MNHFFKTGRGLPFVKGEPFSNQSKLYKPIGSYSPLNRSLFGFPPLIGYRLAIVSSVNVSQSIEKRKPNDDGAPNKSRKEDEGNASTIQVDSALVLPLDYICSTCGPKFYYRSFIRSIPGSDQRTEPRRTAVGAPSEKSRTWLGLGRYLAWASFAISSVVFCLSVGYSLLVYWLSVGCRAKNKQAILDELAENRQAKFLVGRSNVAPESSEKGSRFVRDLFERCSTAVRRYVEAQPNKSRRLAEGVSKLSRTSLENESKSSQRTVEERLSNFGGFAEEVKNTVFLKGPRTKVELALTQAKTKNELGMNYQRTRNELASDRIPSKSFIILHNHSRCATHAQEMNNTTELVHLHPLKGTEMYSKATRKVLKVGGKGTGEVLKRYQTATKYAPTASKSAVGYQDLGEGFTVACSQVGEKSPLRAEFGRDHAAKSMFVNGVAMSPLILSCFKLRCKSFSSALVSILGFDLRRPQIALKCVNVKSINQWSSAIKVAASLIIFCVLFSNAKAQSPTKVGAAAKAPEISQVYRPFLHGKIVFADTAVSRRIQVKIDGTDIRVFPQKDGSFSFRGVYVESGRLKIGNMHPIYVAFDTINRGPFIVNLQEMVSSDKQIDTVAVTAQTGYFQVPEERATGSFVHIDNKLLSRTVGSNILDRLNGVTRGLIFNQRNMGATTFTGLPSMSIRGISTLFANKEPLIILDNFPFDGDINTINPEDIESVTVLQDAAASSIWGARAGNGVIVLTSKKGKFEQPLKVSIRTDVSISDKPNLYYNPTIPMDEVIEIERFLYEKGAWDGAINQIYPYITPTIEALLAHRNGHIDEAEMEGRIAQLKTQDVRRDLNKYVYRPVQLYKGAVNFRGGAKQHNYFFSAGYDKNLGDITGHHDERITLQARNSYRMLKNKLLFDVDLGFSTDTKRTGGDAPYQVLYDRIADENGNPLSIGGGRSSSGLRQSYIDTAGMGLLKDWNFYPLDNIDQITSTSNQISYRVQPSISYKPFVWLGVSANYQFSRSYSELSGLMDEEYFDQRDLYNKFTKINYTTGVATSGIPKGGRLNQTNNGLSSHYFRGSFNIDKTWADVHQFHLIGGVEVNSKSTLYRSFPVMMGYQEATESYVPFDPTVRRYQYLTGALGTAFTITPVNMSRNTTTNRNRLFFGNASYTYDKRYTATFSARKDEANIFGVAINQRGRPFWSAGLRWQLHEEDFYKVDWLSKLVLRATHGYTGNVSNISAYITSKIASDPYSRTGRVYQTVSTPPNPQLSWENVRMSNLALDFSVFNNRLSGSIEYYHKKATDLLSSQPINPSSGVVSLTGNWSSLKGLGWDLNLTGKNIQTKDFLWQSDLILSYVNEKVTDYKLKPTSDINYLTSNLGNYPIEGKPLYGIYSFASAGLDMNGQPQGYLDGQLSQDYMKIYNNTRLEDYIYHGRATPNVFGSIRNTFQYKSFDLSFNISAQLGYYVRRKGINYGTLYEAVSYMNLPFQYDYTSRWQKPGDEEFTHVPVAQYPVVGNREVFYNMTEHLVEKGDHIRLRDIRLGYTMKLPMLGLSSVQFYGYANNLGILWAANKLGFDPDAVYNNMMIYPAVKTFSLGAIINL